MGNWMVVIEGIGPHHNGKDTDIETQTGKFVTELRKSHTVKCVSVVAGSKANVHTEPVGE